MQERLHHQRRPHRSDWWEKKQVQSGVQQTHKHAHTGGVKLTHTPAWVVSSPWQPVIDPLSYVARESENINDGEEAAAEDGKRWHSGWENSVYAHREAHTNVLREGSKKFVFGHVCKATLSRCRLSCSILNCCSLLIVRWTVPIVWTFAVTHVLTQKSKTIHGLKSFICIKKNLSSRFALRGTICRFCNRERFAECEESPVALKDLYQVWNYLASDVYCLLCTSPLEGLSLSLGTELSPWERVCELLCGYLWCSSSSSSTLHKTHLVSFQKWLVTLGFKREVWPLAWR